MADSFPHATNKNGRALKRKAPEPPKEKQKATGGVAAQGEEAKQGATAKATQLAVGNAIFVSQTKIHSLSAVGQVGDYTLDSFSLDGVNGEPVGKDGTDVGFRTSDKVTIRPVIKPSMTVIATTDSRKAVETLINEAKGIIADPTSVTPYLDTLATVHNSIIGQQRTLSYVLKLWNIPPESDNEPDDAAGGLEGNDELKRVTAVSATLCAKGWVLGTDDDGDVGFQVNASLEGPIGDTVVAQFSLDKATLRWSSTGGAEGHAPWRIRRRREFEISLEKEIPLTNGTFPIAVTFTVDVKATDDHLLWLVPTTSNSMVVNVTDFFFELAPVHGGT